MKKTELPDVSPKNTKDQILAAYHEVLEKLSEKQPETPTESRKKQEEKAIVEKSTAHSPDTIVAEQGISS